MVKKKSLSQLRKPATGSALADAEAFIQSIDFDKIDPQKYYATKAAAKLINISVRRLRVFCQDGRIGRRAEGGTSYMIRGDDLIRFARTPRPTGKPPDNPTGMASKGSTKEEFYSVGETAIELGVSNSCVSSLVKRGHLPCIEKYGLRLIPHPAVEARKLLMSKSFGERVSAGIDAAKKKQPGWKPGRKPKP